MIEASELRHGCESHSQSSHSRSHSGSKKLGCTKSILDNLTMDKLNGLELGTYTQEQVD
jgi:hypothetical protein